MHVKSSYIHAVTNILVYIHDHNFGRNSSDLATTPGILLLSLGVFSLIGLAKVALPRSPLGSLLKVIIRYNASMLWRSTESHVNDVCGLRGDMN